MADQSSNDWKVAIITAICTAIVTAVCGWFTIDYQLSKGQVFWREQQKIINRDTEIKAKISFIQEIEQLALQHSTNAHRHMIGHLNDDRETAADQKDSITRASSHKEHSEQVAALYRNYNLLLSRLHSTRFFFSPKTTAISDRLCNELETAPWHPVYDHYAFIATLREAFKTGQGVSRLDAMSGQLEKQMRRAEFQALLREFLDAASQEVSLQLLNDA